MEQLTAKAVFDLYCALSKEKQEEFLKLVGRNSGIIVPMLIAREFPPSLQQQFSQLIFGPTIDRFLPLIVKRAVMLMTERPGFSAENLSEEIEAGIRDWVVKIAAEQGKLEEEKLKAKRNRKSNPDTIRRNVEICDLRKQDPKKWSQPRLAKRFEVTERYIRKVEAEEQKWRQLNEELGTK